MRLFYFLLLLICSQLVPLSYGNEQMPSTIYLYKGPGTSPESLKHSRHMISELVSSHYTLKEIGPKEVISGKWVEDAALFIMPGGADVPYMKHLSPIGNKHIKEYVKNGGAYLGICAGAYYAASEILFEEGTAGEIKATRELEFFKGTAKGPLFGPYNPKDHSSARLVSLKIADSLKEEMPNNNRVYAYYNGGCYFKEASKIEGVTPLLYFKDSKMRDEAAAIIEIPVGKGRVLLSGPHLEYSPFLLNSEDPYLKPIRQELEKHEGPRRLIMTTLLKRLGIRTVPLH